MSGGHWYYLSHKLEEAAKLPAEALRLLSAIEHIMDWGICGDTCYECAKIQVIDMLYSFYTIRAGDSVEQTWVDIGREYKSRCAKCIEWDAKRGT